MATSQSTTRRDTAERVLDVAEELVQKRGFNGFSYADVASALGITTASLHYHFPGKAELGRALIERYSRRFFAALHATEVSGLDPTGQLQTYAGLYAGVLRQDRLCLCGMLAAEYATLPEAMRTAVRAFFEENERWLANVLTQGRESGALRFAGAPEDAARMIVAALEGAMLIARPFSDLSRFQSTADELIAGLLAPQTQ